MAQGFGGITKRHRLDDRPNDGVAFMDRAMRVAVVLASIAALVVFAISLRGCGRTDVEVTAAQVAAADGRKANVSAEDRAAVIQLSHPIGYAATVRDCLPSGRDCSAVRYYIPAGAK